MLTRINEYESIEAWHQHRVQQHEEEPIGAEPIPDYITADLPNGETLAISVEAVADRFAGERLRDLDIEDEQERHRRFSEVATELEQDPEQLIEYLRAADVDDVKHSFARITGDGQTLSELWDDADFAHAEVSESTMLTDGGAESATTAHISDTEDGDRDA